MRKTEIDVNEIRFINEEGKIVACFGWAGDEESAGDYNSLINGWITSVLDEAAIMAAVREICEG